MLKDFAFHVVGTDDEARELDATTASPRCRSPRPARPAAGGRSSRRRASTGRSTRSATSSSRRWSPAPATRSPRPETTGQTEYLHGRPELGRAGRRADEPPVPRPLRPAPDPAPDRRGARRRGAVRDPRGRVPVLPARPRRDRGGRTGSSGRTHDSVAFAPYASRSPFEVWIVPRRHDADFGAGRRAATSRRPPKRCARSSARLATRARRAALQPRPPHRAAARAGRRHLPLALGDPPAPARDRRPRAGNRPAGEPRLARGRGGGVAGPRRRRREVDGLTRAGPGAAGVTPGGAASSLAHRACAAHRPRSADPSRTEPPWPSTRPSPTFATRSAARRRSGSTGAGR